VILYGCKYEAIGGRIKLHNEELHNLYSSPNTTRITRSRRMRWAGHVSRMGAKGVNIGFWRESQKKKITGRPRRRWEDNIKIDLRGIV
jgi:hypothetical protein